MDIDHKIGRAPSREVALELVMEEAEKAMARLEVGKNTSAERNKASRLIARGEHIKHTRYWRTPPNPRADAISRRLPTTAEKIIILKASMVNGGKYPPWQREPTAKDFEPTPDGTPFLDDYKFTLSKTQEASLLGWKRAAEALPVPPPGSSSLYGPPPSKDLSPWSSDLVQDAATDCSVVAALCAATARVLRGCYPLLPGMFYPYDLENCRPELSPSGKYMAKLNFNGAPRCVIIDDRLPVSNTQRLIHIFDRQNPSWMFSALIEKFYLKVFGGYDFPGSNSSTDLWILFGWIPEQIFFTSHDSSLSDTWQRLFESHLAGDVMVTLGTGRMSAETERQTGLAGRHSYAVLDLREDDDQMLMLVKNPWCDGQTWKGVRSEQTSTDTLFGDASVSSPRDLLNADEKLSPGTFWMDIYTISRHFESMYLNWNPKLFKYREDVHFAWELDETKSRRTFIDTPQFTLKTSKAGPVWLLLCRHIQDGDYATASSDFCAPSGGYISLSVFDCGGHRVVLKDLPLEDSAFVDSAQTLLQTSKLTPETSYTVVPNEDGLPHPRHTFTLSVFANQHVEIDHAPNKFRYSVQLPGQWEHIWPSDGGSTDSPFFCLNPQYDITVSKRTTLSLILRAENSLIPVNAKICVSNGGRIQSLRRRDIMGDSGAYRPNAAVANVRELVPGRYTIVCSTFERKQYSNFTLRLDSDHPIPMQMMPFEGQGRFRRFVTPAVFGSEQQACATLLLPQLSGLFKCVVRSLLETKDAPVQRRERSMIRVSIVKGNPVQYQVVSTSSDGDFMDAYHGVRTDEIYIHRRMNHEVDVWLLIERSASAKDSDEETFRVEFFTELKEAVQTGDWQEWEL